MTDSDRDGGGALTGRQDVVQTFVTGVSGYSMADGVIFLTFETGQVDHFVEPPELRRVVAARLVMPVAAAQLLALGLNDYLEQSGVSPTKAIRGDETAQ